METFDEALAINMILNGASSEDAIAAAQQLPIEVRPQIDDSSSDFDVFWVGPDTPVEKIPDAACIARELEGIPEPTREDIERAFQACAK